MPNGQEPRGTRIAACATGHVVSASHLAIPAQSTAAAWEARADWHPAMWLLELFGGQSHRSAEEEPAWSIERIDELPFKEAAHATCADAVCAMPRC